MDSKKKRTLDVYKKVGAEMQLLRALLSKLWIDSYAVLLSTDNDKLARVQPILDELCSKAEDKMFADFPELTNEYIHVFYGRTDMQDHPDDLDREMIALAREVADSLFCSAHGAPEDGNA